MDDSKRMALITGASAGLGMAFARQLAAQGFDLTLVGRRRENLAALAKDLERIDQVVVEILPADLSTDDGLDRVEKRIHTLNRLDLLINNAGYGLAGEFSNQQTDQSISMLQVHCTAPVRLVHAALPGMIERRSGKIINVASMSAFAPMVGNVMYSATKSFLVVFSQALQMETLRQGIQIQALCPGFFHSEFHDVMGVDKTRIPRFLFTSADLVAKRSLAALKYKRVVYVPGFVNKLAVFCASLPGLGDWMVATVSHLAARRRSDFLREE